MKEKERNLIRHNLYFDWEGKLAFHNGKRELISDIVTEVIAERKRVSKLPWYKRLFNKLDR